MLATISFLFLSFQETAFFYYADAFLCVYKLLICILSTFSIQSLTTSNFFKPSEYFSVFSFINFIIIGVFIPCISKSLNGITLVRVDPLKKASMS